MKKKQVLSALMLAFLPLAGYSQGFPVITASPAVADLRIGTKLMGVDSVGIIKYSTPTGAPTTEFGIYTWADGRPIRIGGTVVKFQHESGNPNDVFMSGKLGIGTMPLATSRLAIVGSSTYTTGSTATLTGVAPAAQANGYVANVTNSNYNQGFLANTSGGAFSVGGDFEALSSTAVSTGVIGGAKLSPAAVGGQFHGWQSANAGGVVGQAEGNSQPSSTAVGGSFYADEASVNKGIEVTANAGVGQSNVSNYGVFVDATQNEGSSNYGVRSNAVTFNATATQNYSVWARAQAVGTTCANYGVYSKITGGVPAPVPGTPPVGTGGSYAGYFYDNSTAVGNANGAAFFNGMVINIGGYSSASDRKFKNDIESIPGMMGKIMQLAPVTYKFKDKSEFPSFSFPADKQIGFIAQELEKVFPEIVHETVNPAQYDDNGKMIAEKVTFKSVEYTQLIPVLTKAIQEQQTQIDAQQKQIEELKASLSNNNSGNSTGISNDQNTDQGSLSQNVPNPFSQNTVIGYKLPVSAKSAAIGIYDLNGREIKLVTLGAERTGSVTIDGGTMQAGMYVYSLIVNGNAFATKKMILTSH